MSISVLDCTLRDGGYVNNFKFGNHRIKSIIRRLSNAGVDIVECGFLKSGKNDIDCSLFASVENVNACIENKSDNVLYVAMVAYGDISIDEISACDHSGVEGIRVTFHNNQIEEAFKFGYEVMAKGYKVFMQPVGTVSYTDYEFLQLVEKVNEMNPYAFYIVDTMGTLYQDDLLHLFYMADNNLDSSVKIGYHSHNNLQLAFSNAQALVTLPTKRDIIIDSSVYGMGRGAGNLCTELITQYINDNVVARYDVVSVMEIYDRYISEIYKEHPWGYSVAYFIASVNMCHPNYAQYLLNKQTLSMKDINGILSSLPKHERHLYNPSMIETRYNDFKRIAIDDKQSIREIQNRIADRSVMLIAPGKSLSDHAEQINKFINEESPFVVSINFAYDKNLIDAVFISNVKRLENIDTSAGYTVISTSNLKNDISAFDGTYIVNYYDLISTSAKESDNAGVMAMRLFFNMGVRNIYLAGFDGYDKYTNKNYISMIEGGISVNDDLIDTKNADIQNQIKELNRKMNIVFITPSKYCEE